MNILVVGFGVTGNSVYNFLKKNPDNVLFIYDDNKRDISVSDDFDFSIIDYAVISPGIAGDHKVLNILREKNIIIKGDLDLFFEYKKNTAKTIGVTGTNGKSTTVAMIRDILVDAGYKACACGNFGIPLMDVVSSDYNFFVIELSSYQLESNFYYMLDYGVLLNVTYDHIEHHKTLSNYIFQKLKIIKHSKNSIIVKCCEVIKKLKLSNITDKSNSIITINYKKFSYIKNFFRSLINFLICKQKSSITDKYYFWKDKVLMFYDGSCKNNLLNNNKISEIFDARNLNNISFSTNHENIAAAIVIAREIGISSGCYTKVINNFKGLPHRQEKINSSIGINFINDSKATNLDSTIRAIDNIDKNIVLILGGVSKGDDFSLLENYKYKIKKIYTIGRDRYLIAEQIIGMPISICEDIEDVFQKVDLIPGDTLLFAPACASFDQFKNFEERGEKFREFAQKYIQIYN